MSSLVEGREGRREGQWTKEGRREGRREGQWTREGRREGRRQAGAAR
jgi:hypothetical protein